MPAANVQGQDPNETTPAQEWMVRRLVTSDFLYWSARKLAPKKLIGFLLATGPALLDDIVRDQRLNIAVMMPLAVAFQGLSWWLVHAYPQAMLEEGWHLLLIGLTLLGCPQVHVQRADDGEPGEVGCRPAHGGTALDESRVCFKQSRQPQRKTTEISSIT